MSEHDDKRNWLINQVVSISGLLKEGRYNEIDLTLIEKEAADLASNFGEVINSLESVGYKMGGDKEDMKQISHHLQHISKTTEEGVMQVMDHSESIVSDATYISTNLAEVKKKIGDNPEVQKELDNIDSKLSNLQNNAFTIMTSLEFEDINRQKLEKILGKLNEMYDNLIKVLLMLKVKEKIEKKDSSFIDEIRQISDPNEDVSSKQGMIDELLNEFGL
ncbi:MAG: protein phosphatase CheZ [bacterium]|nr:protein phosphatase CheZ [bacterium]